MIELNIQLFAKSAAYQRDKRKEKAKAIYKKDDEVKKMKEETKPEVVKKQVKGSIVTAVHPSETYLIYAKKGGKEILVAERTGKQVLEKMRYEKDRGWISIAKGRRYIIRKK